MLTNCHTKVTAAKGTTQKNAPRHPTYAPRKLPRGAATVVASALPPFSTASARGTLSLETRRITVAVDIGKKSYLTQKQLGRSSGPRLRVISGTKPDGSVAIGPPAVKIDLIGPCGERG